MRQIVVDNCRANQQDLPFTLTYLVRESEQQAQLFCATGFDDHDPAAPSTIDLKSSSSIWPISSVLEANDSLVMDVKEVSDRLPRGTWPLPANKALLVPFAQRGEKKAAGVLVAGLSPYRILDGDYEGYIKLMAGQLAASLANANAYEQERKRTQALAEIDRAKTMFFSNVSHELRTPLTLMLGPLEDELARADCGAESKHSLELIHRNGLRLLKLVNTLLQFSRVESGRLNSRFEPIDLAKVTAEYASAFHSAVERAGLRFVVDCRPLPEPVYIDREMWENIILNLLSNALKSTFHGEIAVTVRAVEGGAQNREHTSAARVSLADIVLHAITIYEPRCRVAGITIRRSLNSSKIVTLRRGELMQVISNLISNSIYAMPTGGTLSISVEDVASPDDGILLTIQDDGVGIAADDLPRVFDAFFSTRSVVGTGIGLFVAKQFVEGHGGRIEIKSSNDAEHHGTAVCVFLPLRTAYDASSTSSLAH